MAPSGIFAAFSYYDLLDLQHFLLDLLLNLHKALNQNRIEDSALAAKDHLNGALMGEALLIGTFTDEGIVDIGQGYDLGGNRDLVSHQSV